VARLAGIVFALALLTLAGAGQARAAGPIVPDSSCADESTYKSLKGDTAAQLEVINKSPETVKIWWLDYNGKRVLYQQLPPFTMYVQRTWLTHPWVITNLGGRCYRFLVMTSQLQSVTVEGEPPDPDTTALPLSARATAGPTAATTVAPTAAATVAPTAATTAAAAQPTPTPGGGPTTPAGSTAQGPDNTALAVIGAVAAVAVAAGVGLAATGRLPGFRRGGRRP
jgi:hypothetical protein